MAKTVQSRKSKGRKLQQWVGKRISDLLDIPFGKDELIRSREGGQAGTDVVLLGRAKEMFKFSVECKNVEKYDLPSWIKQAKNNQLEETDWLLFCKRNFEEPIVILDAKVFFRIYEHTINREE